VSRTYSDRPHKPHVNFYYFKRNGKPQEDPRQKSEIIIFALKREGFSCCINGEGMAKIMKKS
jgi:hypothetical protein